MRSLKLVNTRIITQVNKINAKVVGKIHVAHRKTAKIVAIILVVGNINIIQKKTTVKQMMINNKIQMVVIIKPAQKLEK